MSTIYVLEPPTKGKVVLKTSCGPLDIELWSKEAPKAVRNFVQLCMEGYYDGTIFHRVIKGFLVQGGDPTGTGTGGESIYGEPFVDEFHTRLKFRHRGFVACANAGTPNSNSSQFFITLDRCDWINDKNTIFGKVTGDTIYNLLKLGESDTDKNDRPLDPQKVYSTQILWNPFDDIVPRKLSKQPEQKAVPLKDEKPAVKQKKKLNLLSFGEEAQQEEEEVSAVKSKIKSSHDVLDDPQLLKSVDPKLAEEKRQKELSAVRQALAQKSSSKPPPELPTSSIKEPEVEEAGSDEDEASFDLRMKQQLFEKKRRFDDSQPAKAPKPSKTKVERTEENRGSEEEEKDEEEEDDDENSNVRKEKLYLKKRGVGSEAKAELLLKSDMDMQMMTPQEQKRQKIKLNKRNLQGREEDTMALLEKFRQSLVSAKTKSKPVAEEKPASEEGDRELAQPAETLGWATHKLKFDVNKKDKMSRNDDIDHYVVMDPLLENGKAQFNKMQAKLKRRNREWAGKSHT